MAKKKVRLTELGSESEDFAPVPLPGTLRVVAPPVAVDESEVPVGDPSEYEFTYSSDRPTVGWKSLDRKEVFLWPDQRDSLDMLERQLSRARGRGKGQRVTANTLILRAIYLLLERSEDLAGVSEEDLRSEAGLSERGQARYLTLERKEVFMWPDQRDKLEALEKRLNRARGRGNGERITANTLIRLAIDLLLERQNAPMSALTVGGRN